MQTATTYNKIKVFVGDKVYQLGTIDNRIQLITYIIRSIEEENNQIIVESESPKRVIKDKATNYTTDPKSLVKEWITKQLEYIQVIVPKNINELLDIAESLGDHNDDLRERFKPLTQNSVI